MYELYEKVRIRATGAVGIIVDVAVVNGVTKYMIEDDVMAENGEYPLYGCVDGNLERV